MHMQQIHAIYENGVLRPLSPLNLAEHQEVSIVIRGRQDEVEGSDPTDDMPPIADEGDPDITWEQVHEALSSIPGNLSDDIIRDRDERF